MFAGAPERFMSRLVAVLMVLYRFSAKFWFWWYGSLYQEPIQSARSICLTRSLISALAQSLINLSIAPRSRMLSSRVLTNSLSVFKP